MTTSRIEGVIVTPLRKIPDERGTIMHMLRRDDPHFQAFGEIYFSTVYPGAIKAWHLHKRMTLNYAVPHGNIKFVWTVSQMIVGGVVLPLYVVIVPGLPIEALTG